MQKNTQIIASLIILLIIIAGAMWYLITQKRAEIPQDTIVKKMEYPDGFFDLTVYDKNIPQTKLESWKKRFENAKKSVIESPDGFHFAGVLDMGAIKKYVGDYRGAESIWIFLGKNRPLNSISFGNLGDLYANFLNEPEKAETAYLTAIKNDSEDVNYYINLSDVYRYLLPEKIDQADDILLRGIEKNPQSVNLLNYIASYYQETGDDEKAIEYYKKSLKIDPDNDTVRKVMEELESG